jgi:HD superfamily phosphohydrolase
MSSNAGPLPEFGTGFERVGSIRVPELRNVPMTRRLQRLIDHPAFQRLRTVRQLGPTHLVYPGAVHTRFEHSLGVYSCVLMYVTALLQHPVFGTAMQHADLEGVLLAGLLHDVGHYPFAHSLEALHLKGRDTPRHEDVGAMIIRGEIEALRGDTPLADMIREDWEADPERVIRLCTGRLGEAPSQVDQLLRSIISGTIDADKMDYLERDSHHMGVPYGRNYDRDRLLASLTLNEDETGVAINAKGKVSAEMFVFSRYTMFSEAYWHHTVRAASAMVEAALSVFHTRSSMAPGDLLDVLLAHDDDSLLEWLRDHSPNGGATAYLTNGLTHRQRRLYKRIVTLSRVYTEEPKQRAYARIYEMDAPQLYGLVDRLRARLSSLVGRSLHPADVIIDTPPRDKDKLETIDVVYPDATGRQHYPLHELSRIVAGIQDDFVTVVKKIRIFVEPSLAAELAGHDGVDEIILTEILKS